MISRYDSRPRAVPPPAPLAGPAAHPAGPRCELGGLVTVINGSDLTTAAAHFRDCMSCQAEFISAGGLFPARGQATGQARL